MSKWKRMNKQEDGEEENKKKKKHDTKLKRKKPTRQYNEPQLSVHL